MTGAPELPDRWLLHRSHDLLVVDKPAGLLCQPGLGAHQSDSLISRVQQQWPTAQLVHRLDRDTSGLILVALCAELHRALSRLFADRAVQKRYLADVRGVPSAPQGWIAHPLAKRQHQPPLYGVDPAGKPCSTHWRVLEARGQHSRLELRPITGRSHQLRVHLQALGHPILGDPLYGAAHGGAIADPAPQRMHLHAAGLRLIHPLRQEPLELLSAAPFSLPA